MRGEDGLRAAQVRVRRHQRVARALGARGQHANQRDDRALQLRNPSLEVQAQIDGDLFVARAACVKATAGIADARDELALDEGVHVLVFTRRGRM